MKRTDLWASTLAFVCLLALLPGLAVVAPQSTVVPFEKRERAERPTLAGGLASVEALPERFEAFFRDHIGLRYRLVQLRHWVKLGLFGESPTDALIVGRDGWLFLADDHALEAYRAERPFAPEELAKWQAFLQELDAWLAARGASLLVVLAPGKTSIYESELPVGVVRAGRETRTDQLVAYLAQTDLAVLDLRPPLRDAARRDRVYHKLDTHWNGDGALVAYRAIVERLADPRVAPLPESALARRVDERSGDLARMLHAGAPRTEQHVSIGPREPHAVAQPSSSDATRPPLAYEVDDPALPRAVVYRDSFATALVPLLSEHFRRSLWIWSRTVDPDQVRAEQPDVVVYELAERYLMEPVPGNPFPERP